MKLTMISVAELEQTLREKRGVLIDVRDASEYQRGHIDGAVNLPFQQLKRQWIAHYFKRERFYVLYCERGTMSLELCRTLLEQGYQAVSLRGGYRAYAGRNGSPASRDDKR